MRKVLIAAAIVALAIPLALPGPGGRGTGRRVGSTSRQRR